MPSNFWLPLDRWMRALHLYTGLFLVPWMAVYATSGLFFNHTSWFARWLSYSHESLEVVRKLQLPAGAIPAGTPAQQARAVLEKLDLDGPHQILGDPNAKELSIYRMSVTGDYRISWRRDQSLAVVRRYRPYSLWRSINSLHFTHGYDARYPLPALWAITVDLVVVSIWFWIVSGIYIWARRPLRRFWGGVCLAGGGLLFALLVALLCR
jgi:hypothetical protein